MSILDSVTELEERVVDTVRSLQQPVVDYVRRSVESAEGRVPKLTYPEDLPRPADIVESQVSFAKALLDSQRDFINDLVDAVSPLVVRPETEVETEAEAAPAAAADEGSKAKASKPRAKSTAAKSRSASTKARK